MKKRTHGIVLAVLVAGLVVVGVVWLLSSGAPSYDTICRLNDEVRTARQLGLSNQEKCVARLGDAIMRTKDEKLLAKLLAHETFEDRFATEMLSRIKQPELIDLIARTFNPEFFCSADGRVIRFSPNIYDAVLDRLPDDESVEKLVDERIEQSTSVPDNWTNGGLSPRRRDGQTALAVHLFRRILKMDNKSRAIALLAAITDSNLVRPKPDSMSAQMARIECLKGTRQSGLSKEYLSLCCDPFGSFQLEKFNDDELMAIALTHRDEEVRLKAAKESSSYRRQSSGVNMRIALQTTEPRIREATGVGEEMCEMGALVVKWDPDYLSHTTDEILKRGLEIHRNQKYVEMVKQFDTEFSSSRFDDWVSYGYRIESARNYIDIVRQFDPGFKSRNLDDWLSYGYRIESARDYIDIVRKFDPGFKSRNIDDWVSYGKRIEPARNYIDIIRQFDPGFKSRNIDDWVSYGERLSPIFSQFATLSKRIKSEQPDSSQRTRLVEKRDKAKKEHNEIQRLINEIRSTDDDGEYGALVLVTCRQVGVRIDEDDPYGTGLRLANKLKQMMQEAQMVIDSSERELANLSRFESDQREWERLRDQLNAIKKEFGTTSTEKGRTKDKAKKKIDKSNLGKTLVENMVQIPGKDYKMGKYEVTQAQWEAVMGENPSRFKNPDNPVEQVSWDDCQEFLKKLNELPSVKKSGITFRLPTEEEWEQACRAGATGAYCLLSDGTEVTGDTLDEVAWFKDNADQKTHPVGQKKPNAWGLYDMHGNVWEWTSTADGGYRVPRGGGWCRPAWLCESSFRGRHSPSYQYEDLGFRLCASGRVD